MNQRMWGNEEKTWSNEAKDVKKRSKRHGVMKQ